MATKTKRTVMRVYKSYNFVDKDPIIDAMRTVYSDSGMNYNQVYEAGGAAAGTLQNWFNGKTRRPQFCTVAASARAMGKNTITFTANGPKITGRLR